MSFAFKEWVARKPIKCKLCNWLNAKYNKYTFLS